MTVYGGGGYGGGTPAPRPAPPSPPPSAPPSHTDASMGYGPANPVVNPPRTSPGQPPSHTDVTGGGYGGSNIDAFKASPAYQHAILSVFSAQPPAQQQAILKGLRSNPWTPEAHAIFSFFTPGASGATASGAIKGLNSAGGGPFASILSGTPLGALAGLPTIAGKSVGQVIGNAGKDAFNLPASTVEGLYGVGNNLAQGHFGNAFHMLVDPYVQLAEHPFSTFASHPLNSLLMLSGPKAVIGRGAGAVARSGALGGAAQAAAATARDAANVGTIAGAPAPIMEARSYSPDVINKAFQVAHDAILRKRGRNPNVVRPSKLPSSVAYALNRGIEAKLHRGADEMTAAHQLLQRSERNAAIQDLQQHMPSDAAKNVVSHALQGVLRTPESAVADATAEINRLRAVQTGKRTPQELWNRQQVRDLATALRTPGALQEAMGTAAKLRPILHNQDAYEVTHGLLDAEQAQRSRLFPYAIAHMGAKPGKGIPAQFLGDNPVLAGLERADGTRLTTQEILDHLKANGVPDPAFVGHYPGKISPGRFASTYRLARGTLGKGKRTGAAFVHGAYDHTWNGLIGQTASRAQAIARASLHDRAISRYGITVPPQVLEHLRGEHPNIMQSQGRDFTPAEAKAMAYAAMVDDHGNPVPGALELTPISRGPKQLLNEVHGLQNPRQLQNVSQLELRALANAVEDAARRNDNTRNVALIPKIVADRFASQYARTDGLTRSVGRVTQQFRRTVLPYSTHWMLQIGSEAGLRSLIAGALDPRYLVDGRRLTRLLEKTPEGRAANAEMTSATLYHGGGSGVMDALRGRAGRGTLDIHNPHPGKLAAAAKSFLPSRILIAAHNRYADTVTAAMYALEHNARLMGLGKLAHQEVHSFGTSWADTVRLQGEAIGKLADRLQSDPALVAKFGRSIDNMFGKYSKFTPMQRAAIQSIAPFLPWYLNAAKYVFWHLPAHHPVASALMASLRQTVNQDMKDGKNLPLNSYAMEELARISPFGIFTPPDQKPSVGGFLAGQHITGAVLPQIESLFYNLAGRSSFGSGALTEPPNAGSPRGEAKPLSGPAGAAAAESLLEAFLPLTRYAREAQEGGKPSYGTSTVLSPQPKLEPGGSPASAGSALARIFNPFYSFERAKHSQNAPDYGKGRQAAQGSGGSPSLSQSLGGGGSSSGADLSRSLGGGGGSSGSLTRSLGGG